MCWQYTLNCKKSWYQRSRYLIAVWLSESGEADGQQGLATTREAAQTLVEGFSSLPDAPKLWLFRSVHKIAHDCQERAAWADSFSASDMHIQSPCWMNAQTCWNAHGSGQDQHKSVARVQSKHFKQEVQGQPLSKT